MIRNTSLVTTHIVKAPPLIKRRDRSLGKQVDKASNSDSVMVNGDGCDSSATTLEGVDGKYSESSGLPTLTRPALRLRTVDMSNISAQAHCLGVSWAGGTFSSPVGNEGALTTSNWGRLNKFTRDGINENAEEGIKVSSSAHSYRKVYSR